MRTHLWALALLSTAAMAAAAATFTDAAALESFEDTSSKLKRRSPGVKKSRINKTIYKGRVAKAREHPYQVYVRVFLEDGSKDFCGGAIIGPRHVLSAAHCVQEKDLQKVCSIVGHQHRFHKETLKFTVVRKHFYPKKPKENVDSDIVVFMVDRPIPLQKANTQQIKLMGRTQIKPNTTCSISGWGTNDDPKADSNLMRQAKVPIVSQELCRKAYPKSPSDDLLCAGFYEKGGADACKGDSGGPLVCNGLLTGIVKSGKGCGLPHYPGTYTDVRYYWTWIKKVMTEDMRKEASSKTKHTNLC